MAISIDGGVPSGTVRFLEGASVLDTETLDANGHATFTTSSLSVGTHAIVASYDGNSRFGPSRSVSLKQTVQAAGRVDSTTHLTSSSTSPTAGRPIMLTATIKGSSGSGVPTGSVTFLDGSTVLGTVGLDSGGKAELTTSALGAGSHTITASYGGDSHFAPSTSRVAVVVSSGPSGAKSERDGPAVASVERLGYHAQPTMLVLNFDGPLDPAGAQDPGNYRIRGPRRRFIGIRSVEYDPVDWTVILHPRRRLSLHRNYLLVVNGAGPGGVTGMTGLLLDGDRNGEPGGNFSTVVDRRNLVRPAIRLHSREGLRARPIRVVGHVHPMGPRSLAAD